VSAFGVLPIKQVLIISSPFVSYDSVNLNGTRLSNLQSFVEFDSNVKSNTLPQYAHISPDMLNDGHNTSLQYAANWTQSFLTPLLSNEQFMNRTLILLTYDESATYPIPNHIVSLLLGGAIPANKKGTTDDTMYTHYSILSTLENNWELPNLGRYDVGANIFQFVADQTGYANHAPSNAASVNNSLSYPGFLNNDASKYLPVPAPNLQLIGAGGQGVDYSVHIHWNTAENQSTPYDGSGTLYDGGNGVSDSNAPVYKAQAPAPNVTSMGSAATSTNRSAATRAVFLDIGWLGLGGFLVAALIL
jgi:acid phosphatase